MTIFDPVPSVEEVAPKISVRASARFALAALPRELRDRLLDALATLADMTQLVPSSNASCDESRRGESGVLGLDLGPIDVLCRVDAEQGALVIERILEHRKGAVVALRQLST